MINRVKFPIALLAMTALSACGIFKGGDKKTPVLGDRVPILVSESDTEVDPTLAGQEVLLPPAVANTGWTQPGGNESKAMGHLALAAQPTRAWSVSIPGGDTRVRLAATPVIDGTRLYVSDVNGAVHAIDTATGATVWRAETARGDENQNARFGGGVSVEGDRLYASNGVGDVVAMNIADGSEIWRVKPGGPLRGAPTIANGALYILTQDNQLFALNTADGKTIWTQSGSLEAQGVFGVAAPASAQGTVVAGFSSGELNAYRYENGRSVWADSLSRTSMTTSVSSLADIDAFPVIDNGRVYAVGQGGRMVALEILSGQRLWEQNIAGISTPWVVGEWIFVVTDEARLMAISRGNGRIRWISQLPRWRNEKKKSGAIRWVGPVLAGDRLLVASSRGVVASASPADGTLTTIAEGKTGYTLPPVVAGNTMYLLDDAGELSAYR
ncbi:PQQ-like beta-propeller repeat protein [Sphingomonas sp. S1-29]|uniref:outer membrane protein assembly factor BamB family protein n=1 Tax=Sphingomonas sp. S1-29 TaxID=2991074 RepID=UPI00223FF0EA|nr:PQQ-binding-like beta-propeller repeat protein [Sphingomonas sp. S1-29]UZK71021.1 PQQ-like beta-propeller repeat protein [Sphingomonas sp. S1-29]